MSGDNDLTEYSVEIAVHGTWRDSVVADNAGEAADVIEQRLEEQVASLDGWGDLGFEFVGMREIED